MRKVCVIFAALAAILIAGTLLSARTEAAPVMSQAGVALAVDQAGDGLLQLVAQGCGPGFARGPYGRCRPIGGGVVVTPGVGVVVTPRPVCVRRCGPLGCKTVCR